MSWPTSTPRRRAVTLTAATAAVTSLALAGVIGSLTAAADTGAAGPRKDWTTVVEWSDSGIAKRCDGTTLLYLHAAESTAARSLAVVPDSPECAR